MAKNYFNNEYEKCILGILLLDNSLIDIISGRLSKESFYDPKCKFIYDKICEQWENDRCVNLLTLSQGVEKIDPVWLSELTNVGSTSNWEFYVSKVKELHLARSFKNELGTTLSDLDPDKVNESIANLQSKLTSFMQFGGDSADMKNLCISVPEEMQEAYKANKKYLGFETGFESLDQKLDGFQTSQLYVIGARPSIGKTAFALTIMRKLCQFNTSVAMFSLEMSAKACFYRMLASESGLPLWQLRKGTCFAYQSGFTKTSNGLSKLFNYDMNIIDTSSTDKALYSRIRYEATIKGKKVFVVDHLGLVQIAKPSAQHYLDVGRITAKLHSMAKELDVCIILLCQMNREAEGKKPNLSLIRESGNIEQDADVIMLLHRERDLEENNIPTDVIIEKNRDGQTGTVHFIFNKETQNFREDKGNGYEEKAPVVPVAVKVEKEREEEYVEEELPF